MSDKSFGDHTNRNILKNPLLSSAVTGLSIEDLTHNAVLLPVAQSQEVIGRQDQLIGHQTITLAHTERVVTNNPSGDANITLTTLPPTTPNLNIVNKENEKHNVNAPTMPSVSKASLKSEDDFDVNEYFARLQGTRYVSAPLNSLLKEDKNANLEATEENLEEINLNEPEKNQNIDVQQSLTADIAKNFSQLPTVLPQVASAVYSSFSNMLSMKSREQTPDEGRPSSAYQEVQFQRPEDIGVPLMGVEEQQKEVAPPPKEPPTGGTLNYRITTKKKAYAQIPGLSYGDNVQNFPGNPSLSQSMPPIFTPTPITNTLKDDLKVDDFKAQTNEVDRNVPKGVNLFNQSQANNEAQFHSTINYKEPNLYSSKVDVNPENALEQPVQVYGADIQVAAIAQPAPPIIPPPPMFSNSPRKDNQIVGKSVLPPSVARRISANQPIIKPQTSQASVLTPNIFVPHMETTNHAQVPSNLQTYNNPQVKGSTTVTPMFVPISQSIISNVIPPATTFPTQIAQMSSNFESAVSSESLINVPLTAFEGQSVTSNVPASRSNVPSTVQQRSLFTQENLGDITNKQLPPTFNSNLMTISARESQQAPSTITAVPLLQSASISSSQTSSLTPPSTNMFNPTSIERDSQPLSTPSNMNFSVPPTNISVFPAQQMFQLSSTIDQSISKKNNSISTNASVSNVEAPLPPSFSGQNVPIASTFFNPNITVQSAVTGNDQGTAKQFYESTMADLPKPVAEPPKATGNQNYRLTKKRPQYYAGPIEGVGSISNNFKPILPNMESSSFEGALFTPSQESHSAPQEQELVIPNIEQATVPFDISKQGNTYTQFDFPKPQETGPTTIQSNYNTAFDLSRSTTENYEEPKQESKGFGIIGSLKSKLSSIDINKIQNTVTTFFDPAYNDTKTDGVSSQENRPYEYHSNPPPSYGHGNQEFGIFVPSEQPQIPSEFTYQNYQNQYNNPQYYQGQNSSNYYQGQEQVNNYYMDLSQNSVPNYNPASHSTTSANLTETSQVVDKMNNEISIWSNITTTENVDSVIATSVKPQQSHDYTQSTAAPSEEAIQNLKQIENNWQTQNYFGYQPPIVKESVPQTFDNTTDISKNKVKSALDLPAQHFFKYQSPVVEESITETNKTISIHETAPTEENNLPSQNYISCETSSIKNKDEELKIVNLESSENTLTDIDNVNEKDQERNTELTEAKEALLLSVKNHIQMPENTYSNFTYDFDNKNNDLFQIIESNQILNQENASNNSEGNSSQLYDLTNVTHKVLETQKLEHDMRNMSLNEEQTNEGTVMTVHDTNDSFDENSCISESKPVLGDNQGVNNVSDFNICETCREVNKPEEKETEDLTSQLIENIIAPIQLLNPVEVPLTESNTPVDDRIDFDTKQCAEISHIAGETIEALQIQSATKLLDEESVENVPTGGYGWCTDNTMDTSTDFVDHNYTFQMDPDSIGFYGSNSLFFDNMPNNASDEIKAEFKNSHEDSPVVLPRQISIPSAPPAPEDDSKSDDNGGLDVHSIEQDAKKDFPFFEEFVIDPSETDDDKIEYKERERTSEDPIPDVDTFTNRVEKFKKMEETGTEENDDVLDVQISQKIDLTSTVSPAITIASYFDTGNYAAEAHYRNTVSSPYNQFQVGSPNVPMRIPPGFEDEYKRKLSGISSEDIIGDNKNEPHIPDTYTQTRPSNTSTYSIAHKPIVELPNTELQVLRKSPNDLQKLPPLATLVSENMYQTQIEESLPKIEDKELFASGKLPSFASIFGVDKEDSVEQKKGDNALFVGIHSATTDVARKTQILSELKKEENIPLFGITPATTEFLKKSQVISEPKKEEITPFFGISSVTTEFPGESQIISEPRKEDITPFFGISSATTEFLGKSQIISEPKKEEITPFFGITSATTEFTGKSQIISEPRKEEITPFFGISSATTEVPGKSQIISEPRKEEITPFFGISSTTTEFPGKSQIISEPRKEEITPFFGISSATTEFPGNSQIISEPRKEEITPFLGISSATTEFSGKSQIISEPKIEENTPFFGISPASTELAGTSHIFSGKPLQANEQNPLTQTLPDPISFFSAAEKSSNKQEESDNNFNRLASYFTTPTKTDPAKSFFELSQSQNHYRHASSEDSNLHRNNQPCLLKHIDNIPLDKSAVNCNLIKDLTSIQNLETDQIVRTVNYFTVEYNNVNINELKVGEPGYSQTLDKDIGNSNNITNAETIDNNEFEETIADDKFFSIVKKCKYCCNNARSLLDRHFKVRKTMDNDNTESRREGDSNMESEKLGAVRKDVTVNFNDVSEESSDGVAVLTEQRAVAEYTPVKHHWFYRVDLDNKSMWRGFSIADSRALEESFHSANLNENTVVATDGGRYDVNIVGRLRVAVYWADKPTNVRRCSWFYKGTTDPRYVPYSEAVAEKLEEEYRHGITTGEWHRRLILPNNESVVMHGPGVMVHLLQSTTDGFSSTPLFTFGKRVYRNPLKIRVSRDQPQKIDHLVMLVHGAGEYRIQKEIQSTIRPRVVRRGWDETEIEDTEPSSIDHLLLLCHGVGSVCDMRLRSVEKVVDDFRATSLQLLQSHYRNSYDNGIVNRIEVLPISWHSTLHSSETGVDRRLAQITLDSIPKLRNFTNDTVLDVLFYTSPVFCQTILDTVCTEINRVYNLFSSRNPGFKGSVSLGGHSLGSVILYDLLCHQTPDTWESPDKRYVSGPAGTGQASVRYPRLDFSPATLYALGSPIAMFECIRGVESLGGEFALPTCKNFFNIFHPYDPIAYRIEPLINPQLRDVKPFLIPHHKGRKRMHLELKDTMARVGADLKQKLIESLKSTWSNMWRTQSPPTDGQLEKVVEEEMEKEQLCEEIKEDVLQDDVIIPGSLGKLNCGRRVDYVLQEAPFEMINEYLFAMSSHVCYWESEDTMLLILREIYSSLGVQPDCTVPQQSMTVQRTRPAREEETIVMNAAEHPSTSRGET